MGLNDVCDGLTLPATSRPLPHANKTRDSDMMEELFRETLKHLQATSTQNFGIHYQGLPRRFTKNISDRDSAGRHRRNDRKPLISMILCFIFWGRDACQRHFGMVAMGWRHM